MLTCYIPCSLNVNSFDLLQFNLNLLDRASELWVMLYRIVPFVFFPPLMFPTVSMSHLADPNESLSSFSISHITKYMSRKTLVIDTASTKADSVCRR